MRALKGGDHPELVLLFVVCSGPTRTSCFLHGLQDHALAHGTPLRHRGFTSSGGDFAVLSPSATGQQHSSVLHSTLVLLLHRSACMCSMCTLPDLQASCLRASSLALFLPLPLHTTCILHVIACPTCVDYTSQLPPTYHKAPPAGRPARGHESDEHQHALGRHAQHSAAGCQQCWCTG